MKILMALMGLEIGGAETHVLELCKALRKRGHEVFVASNGGVYERELELSGVKHFAVPLHNKNLFNLFKSYRELKKIILDNDIKLVHAHARIPAFLCGLLQKKLKFQFVTTAHWIFKSNFPLNVLTNWGQKCLAVSDDIKKYLVDSYDMNPDDIMVTINGIDTEKFSCDVSYKDIIKEFGFEPENKRYIVCVSRLDRDRSFAAHKLLDVAESICKDNIEIIIIGAGNDRKNLVNRAELLNSKVGRKIVHLVGARADVNKFLSIAEIFVGVSRAALEAMSARKPVILAGNEGYIGIFDKSKFDVAMKTNFCCRDCNSISSEILQADLQYLLNKDSQDLKLLSDYGYEVVKKYYSVDRMAQDALNLYETVRYRHRKFDVMISGYYGFKNNGDDSVLKAIIDDLRVQKPDIKIVVLSLNPFETSKLYGVESIYRYDFFSILAYIKQTDLLISGGGSLIQDITSTHSLKYYLWIINLAIKNSVKVMLYSNGIGPVVREKNKLLVKKILNKVDLITLRDENSKNVLKEVGVDIPKVVVTADATMNLRFEISGNRNRINEKFGIKDNFFVVSIRSWKFSSGNFDKNVAALINFVHDRYGLLPVFVPMHPTKDLEITKRVISLIKCQSRLVNADCSLDDLINLISCSEFVLGMRLHTIIYAIQTSTPILGLVYDPKVKSIMDDINQSTYMDVKQINLSVLKSFVINILGNKNEISAQISEAGQKLKEKAKANTELALELLNKPIF